MSEYGKEVWREETLKPLQVEKEHLQPIRFQGQSFDEETGLHYNRFRYYDPDMGMFISRDPIGLMGGSNVFVYAKNPINWVDPLGLTAKCPSKPPKNDPNWNKYYGKPRFFHCKYDGYLENRPPTPSNPMAECFYDKEELVTREHRYSECGGTPDQYGKDDPTKHVFIDSGGIVRKGLPAAAASLVHAGEENIVKPIKNKFKEFNSGVDNLTEEYIKKPIRDALGQ